MMKRILIMLWALLVATPEVVVAADQVYFYHTDPAGTPLAMSNASGTVVWTADYKPFGEENSVTAEPKNNKRFVGKEKDEETGLSYFGARYEDARIGRFIAVDPVRAVDAHSNKTNEQMLLNPQRLNMYAYALSNPYTNIDHDGQFSVRAIPYMDSYLFRLSYDYGVEYSPKFISLVSKTFGKKFGNLLSRVSSVENFMCGNPVTYDASTVSKKIAGISEPVVDAYLRTLIDSEDNIKLENGTATESQIKNALEKFANSDLYNALGYPSPKSMIDQAKKNSDSSPIGYMHNLMHGNPNSVSKQLER